MSSTPIVLSRYSEHDRAHAERIQRELSAMGLAPRGETVEQEVQREESRAIPAAPGVLESWPGANPPGEAEAPAYVLLFGSAAARARTSANALTSLIALAEQRSALIVPVRLDDTELPGWLGSISSIDARGGPDAELAALHEFLGREGFGPERRPRELAPRPRGAVRCRDALGAMTSMELRLHLKTRLSLNDVREVWMDVFASRLDDDVPGVPLGLALGELLLRADKRRVRDALFTSLCANWPDLGGGSPGIDGWKAPRRARRVDAGQSMEPPHEDDGAAIEASPIAPPAPTGSTAPIAPMAPVAPPPHGEGAATSAEAAPAVPAAPAGSNASAAPAGSTAPAAQIAPTGQAAATTSASSAGPATPRAHAAGHADVPAAKDALERDFTGFWGAKVFWLALFTVLPLLAPLKLHFLHLEVSPATCYYGLYHGLGIWLWASIRDGFQRPRLYKDGDWLTWRRWSKVHHWLGYGVYLLLAVTFLGKVTLVFLGSHTIPFPSWVKEFVGI